MTTTFTSNNGTLKSTDEYVELTIDGDSVQRIWTSNPLYPILRELIQADRNPPSDPPSYADYKDIKAYFESGSYK